MTTKDKPNKESKEKLLILNYAGLASDIKSGLIRPVYLLAGEEEYLLDKVLTAIKKRVLSEGSGEADLYISDRASGGIESDELRSLLYTPPFLSSRRLTILKNTGLFSSRYPENPEQLKVLSSLFMGLPEFSCAIFVEPKIDKRRKYLLEIISGIGVIADIGRQTDTELFSWVSGMMKRDNIRITPDAVASLLDRTERNMRVLDQETRKVILYCQANTINVADQELVEKVSIPDLRGSVFKMMDAIGMRRTEDALLIFDKLISLREPITKIRFLLSKHIRHLICAKELGKADIVSAQIKVLPFVARNLVNQSRLFSSEELVALYRRCYESDVLFKSGRMEERQSLEWVLFSV